MLRFHSLPARLTAAVASLALLSACGGGGGSGTVVTGGGTGAAPTPTPSPAASACSLSARKDWVQAQMNEWYLFPETLPATINPAAYADVQSFIDALTATARAQRKDRYFTYITSIAEETAYYNSGRAPASACDSRSIRSRGGCSSARRSKAPRR